MLDTWGDLPRGDVHCAILAVMTLHKALADYLLLRGKRHNEIHQPECVDMASFSFHYQYQKILHRRIKTINKSDGVIPMETLSEEFTVNEIAENHKVFEERARLYRECGVDQEAMRRLFAQPA